MFFDIFSMLCEEKGVSRYVAAQAVGCNRSAVAKWKSGSVPNGTTLKKLADYFGVTTDYFYATSKDAYIAWVRWTLRNAKHEYENETDPEKKWELASKVDGLQESLMDLEFAEALPAEKEKAAAESDGLQRLLDDERVLLHSYRTMTEEDKQMMLAWVRRLKGGESD